MEKRFLDTMKAFWEKNDRLLEYRPFPDIDDRAAYDSLPQELREAVILQGKGRYSRSRSYIGRAHV